jgi:hypothetical protein
MPLQDLINEAGEQSDEKIVRALEDAARCAYAGAEALDEIYPNWVEAITEQLDLADDCQCVLGQVYDPKLLPAAARYMATKLIKWTNFRVSGYTLGKALIAPKVGLLLGSDELNEWVAAHGFDIGVGDVTYDDLTWAWERVIAERRRPSPFQVVAEVEVAIDEETGAEARARRDAEWAAAGRPPAGPLPELPAGWTSPHAEGDLHGCSVPGCEVCP